MSEVLFRDVVVVNHDRLALELSQKLNAIPRNDQRPFFAASQKGGAVYLFADERVSRDTVLECVMSLAGDAITSLYKVNPIFATPGELLKARERLVDALAAKIGLSVEAIGIDDPGRGRALGLEELSTGQLIDLLAERVGESILTTDSHVVGGAGTGPATLTVQADGSIKAV